jgi:hypothetical protein
LVSRYDSRYYILQYDNIALDSANALRAFYQVVSEEEGGIPVAGTTDFRAEVGQAAKKFYAQRNLYLTGFTILLLL